MQRKIQQKGKRLQIALNLQAIGQMRKTIPSRTLWILQKPFLQNIRYLIF